MAGRVTTGCLDFARHDKQCRMTKREKDLWQGIDPSASGALTARDYRSASFAQEISQRGVDAGELLAADRTQRRIKEASIPGVEVFARKVHPQHHRGFFGEFVRRDEGYWAVAEAMVGCANVCAHCERFSRASTQRSRGQRCGGLVAPLIR